MMMMPQKGFDAAEPGINISSYVATCAPKSPTFFPKNVFSKNFSPLLDIAGINYATSRVSFRYGDAV